MNSRLDELQAAILRARLPFLAPWTRRRREVAGAYRRALEGHSVVEVPAEYDGGHVYHLFVVRVRPGKGVDRRAALQRHLKDEGIDTLVHYPIPITRQPALAGADPAGCAVADSLCAEVLSLPMHPALGAADAEHVAAAVARFERGGRR